MTNLVYSKEKTQASTSASILVNTLIELGVDSVFGYPGAAVLSVYDELSKVVEIKHYLVRHEQAAVHAAEGYARVSGKVGVVLVTSGPGFTNTITGIANAYADSTPLVVLAGDVAETDRKGKVFQNVNVVSIAKSCCKKTFKINSKENISDTIRNAFREADTGVKGPVVVSLPRNILEKIQKNQEISNLENPKIIFQDLTLEIEECKNILNNSQKPLLLLGGGCIDASEEIKKFANQLNIPVISTLMGIGIYPSETEQYLGMIGLNGTDSANKALKECDVLLALGTAFSDRSTCKKSDFGANCKIVSININHNYNGNQLKINADIKNFVTQCLERIHIFKKQNLWFNNQNEIIESVNSPNISNSLQSSFVLKTVSEYTRDFEPIVVTDVGQHQMLTAHFFNFNKPRKFITSGGLGTMGFGLPAAIGAHIADPNNLILNITGDGSFQMNLQELATCREHHIPVKIIIMNNSYLGMVRQMQEKIYNNTYQVEMTNPDFTKIAEAYDLFAIQVRNKKELIPALHQAISHKGTAIIDIAIDSFENI